MEPNIEEVISYKTNDDRIFGKKDDAIKHAGQIIEKKELVELVQQVANLFKPSMDRYKNVEYDEDYELEEFELEVDFWEKHSSVLSDVASDEIIINSFENFIKLTTMLMKEYHLEEIIKLIKNRSKMK